ncbi:MAG: ATP-binding protein [Candidatus Kapabacteria bacterium]|nr:ATP-binding protein [Candidatus Kapabacteria bacterium]
MNNILIGRKKEQEILLDALTSKEAEMVAVLGRRRVGKTFLVKQTYSISFEITGLPDADTAKQLENFTMQLARFSNSKLPIKAPDTWLEAFGMLARFLDEQIRKKKVGGKNVVFFDELPWLARHKSGFMAGLEWFWNSWAAGRNIVVVICGSAASWMIRNVVNAHGGLHNRITRRIFLQPFTLHETELFLQSRGLKYNRFQIVQLYMALGGIPHYLKEIRAGQSAVQNISRICFAQEGLLRDEFSRLYHALFAHADNHIAVVRVLAASRQGLSRPNIINKAKLPEGGNSSKVLEELEQSGFITSYTPFGKQKKETLYRLTDEYSLFYLRFIERNTSTDSSTWNHLSQTPSAKVWSGYAYENTCLKHLQQLKKALGIAGVYAEAATFLQKALQTRDDAANDIHQRTSKGVQIDLLLDRKDGIINIFEMKFYNAEIALTQADARTLQTRLQAFAEATKTNKQLVLTLVTVFGLQHNKHSLGLVEQVLTLDDLFAE